MSSGLQCITFHWCFHTTLQKHNLSFYYNVRFRFKCWGNLSPLSYCLIILYVIQNGNAYTCRMFLNRIVVVELFHTNCQMDKK